MADNRDWSKTGTIQGMAEWLRKQGAAGGGGCLFVCVVRVDDLAIAADPQLAPRDLLALFEDRLPELRARLEAERKERQDVIDRRNERAARRATR
jgi:hypothetical protein